MDFVLNGYNMSHVCIRGESYIYSLLKIGLGPSRQANLNIIRYYPSLPHPPPANIAANNSVICCLYYI